MKSENRKPVIFLAFANDRDDTVKYLRNLPVELRQVRAVLESARSAGLCDLVERANATTKDFLDVFQHPDYRHRIAIFHYGGHANGYQLLLESPEGQTQLAHADGLAEFLAQQNGLQLVFLNGCSTQQQVQGLQQAGVPSVIATSQDIDDAVATTFATRFYQGLASGASIRTAFIEAAAALRTEKGDNPRHFYLPESPREDRWPWELYPKEGSEIAHQWNLREAGRNPLFGLPPLPLGDLPPKPYQHLHSFTRKHAEVFFGRGRQIRALYDLVTSPNSAPIILLYGQSGVGKSSLLEAGLMPHLESSHVIGYHRRKQEIGLSETLLETLGASGSVDPDTSGMRTIAQAWSALEKKQKKPLVMILDQIEEVYTRPNADLPDELQKFFEELKATFADSAQRPQGKLILGFRKEWLAEIEKRLSEHDLFHTKVFLERLDRGGIMEAVAGPARSPRPQSHYGLTITDGLTEIIADDLLADRDSPIAPTLQILLTKMWDEATQLSRSRPRFDHDLYNNLKKHGILLQDFLNQQLDALRSWQPEVVDSGLALDVLAFHTTPLGSAEQRTAKELEKEYSHRKDVLPALVLQCKDLYLLVDPAEDQPEEAFAKATRLTHDTLAPLIRKQFDESDKPGQRARRILENRSVEWRDGGVGTPLDEGDLVIVEQGEKGMRAWKADEHCLIKASQKKRAQKERLATSRQLTAQAEVVRASFPQLSLLLTVEALNVYLDAREPHTAEVNALLRSLSNIGGKGVSDEGGINVIAISPDSKWLVTGSTDGTTRLWHLTAENPASNPKVLSGHKADITAIAISPDTKWLVTGSEDRTARLWDLTAKNPASNPEVLSGHQGGITAVAISPDNKWLVTISRDRTARLWDLTAKNPASNLKVLSDHGGEITSVAISPDNKWLVTGSADRTARLWDLTTKNPAINSKALSGHEGGITAATISPDNKWLVTGSADRTARLWDLTAEDPASNPIVLSGHEGGIRSIATSPDAKWLVTGSADRTARLWDLTAEDPASNPIVLSGHEGGIRSIATSPDAKWLVTGSEDRTARLWDLMAKNPASNPQVLFGPEGAITSVAISSDNHWLVSGSEDYTARLWDLTAKNRVTHPKILPGHEGGITDIAISPDAKWLVTASVDRTARLWDLTAGDAASNPIVLSGHKGGITDIAISPDAKWLVTASQDGTARLWELTAKNPASNPQILSGYEGGITAVAISPNNKWLVTGGNDGTARLWDLTARNRASNPMVLSGHEAAITAVAISSDDHWLVTGSLDRTIRLWDLMAQNPASNPRILSDHKGCISAVAISPDNNFLVTGSDDRTVRLRDLRAKNPGQNPKVLFGHEHGITGVAISSDNKWLVTGSWDNTVRLWDLTAKNPASNPIVLVGHEAGIYAADISADNHWLVTGSEDGTARLWNLRLGELVNLAGRTVGRNLSYAEWQEYFPGQPYRKTFLEFSIHHSFIVYGRILALNGDVDGAIKIFQRAKELEPSLEFDPKAEAEKVAAEVV